MNEFKVNTIYKNESSSFQSLMNELFITFVKNKIDTTFYHTIKENHG